MQLTLQMQVQNLQTDDEIAVRLNGQLVAGWQRDANERLTAPVRPALLRQGSNPVSMRLVKRAATSAAPRHCHRAGAARGTKDRSGVSI